MSTNQTHYKTNLYLRYLCALLLLLALRHWEYGYYEMLRWTVSGTAMYSAWLFNKQKSTHWAAVFVLIAALFNPVLVISFSKSSWQIIDVVVSILFIYSSRNDLTKKGDPVD